MEYKIEVYSKEECIGTFGGSKTKEEAMQGLSNIIDYYLEDPQDDWVPNEITVKIGVGNE